MNRDQIRQLLRIRRELTGEQFNDETIDAWRHGLTPWTEEQANAALVYAAREHQRVNLFHVTSHLEPPKKPPAIGRHDVNGVWHPSICGCEWCREGDPPMDTGPIPTFPEGIRIAWQAYTAECHRQDRAPNAELFGRTIEQFR